MLHRLKQLIVYYSLIALNGTPLVANLDVANKAARFFASVGKPVSSLLVTAATLSYVKKAIAQNASVNNAITEGRTLGPQLRNNFAMPSISSGDPGGTITLNNGAMAGQSMSSSVLAPNAQPNFISNTGAATAGGKASLVNLNNQTRADGGATNSTWAQGFQAINNSASSRQLYDYRGNGDTFLNMSDSVTGEVAANGGASGFSGCYTATTGGGATTTTVSTAYDRSCRRNIFVNSCSVTRNGSGSPVASPAECNTTEICTIKPIDPYTPPTCTPGTLVSSGTVMHPSISQMGMRIENWCTGNGNYLLKVTDASLRPVVYYEPYQFEFNPTTNSPATYSMPNMGGEGSGGADGGPYYWGAYMFSASCTPGGDSCTFTFGTDQEAPNRFMGSVTLAANNAPLHEQLSTAQWICNSASRTTTYNGSTITAGTPAAGSVPLLYPGEDHAKGFCTSATARNFACHQNPYTGETAPASTCGTIQSDPTCTLSTSTCVVGTEASCLRWNDTYSCSSGTQTITNPVGQTSSQVICPGPIRCMGEECTTLPSETNTDFNGVASAFGLATGIAMDSGCDANGNCKIFGGNPQKCEYSEWGFYDCCDENPPDISIVDWVKMGFATWNSVQEAHTVANAMAGSSSAYGQWSDISRGTAQAIDDWLYKPVASAWDSITSIIPKSTDVPAVGEVSSSLMGNWSISGLQSELFNGVIDFAQSLGIDQNVLMNAEGTGIFTSEAGQTMINWAGNEMMSMIGEFMFWFQIISWALIIYQIIFHDCGKRSVQLALYKKLNLCVDAGEYCSAHLKVFFIKICRESTKSYCCFNSVLAKLVNQQGRAQLGLSGFGDPKNPDCSGFTTAQMEQLDFSKMDLSEYMNTLNIAGVAPANVMANIDVSSGTRVYSGGSPASGAPGSADLATRTQAMGMNATNTSAATDQLANDMVNMQRSGLTAPGQ